MFTSTVPVTDTDPAPEYEKPGSVNVRPIGCTIVDSPFNVIGVTLKPPSCTNAATLPSRDNATLPSKLFVETTNSSFQPLIEESSRLYI